jgi:signal transduction histidine kinase
VYPFGSRAPGGAVRQVARLSLAPPGHAGTARDSVITIVANRTPWRLEGGAFRPLREGLQGGGVNRMRRLRMPTGEEALLVTTNDGLRQWDGRRWQPVFPAVRDTVVGLDAGMEENRPVLYVGGPHRVYVIRADTTIEEPIPKLGNVGVGYGKVQQICSVPSPSGPIVFVHESERGAFWRPARAGQPWQLLPPQVRRELLTIGISDVKCLSKGRVAIGTFSKMVVVDVRSGEPDAWRVLTQVSDADGLPSSAVLVLSESSVPGFAWVGTELGVGLVNIDRAASLPPARLVLRVTTGSRAEPVGSGAVLAPDENDLQVSPLLLSFHREEDSRIRLRLRAINRWGRTDAVAEGDTVGSEWLESTTRDYRDLVPGSYLLSAWAIDWAGREYGPVHQAFTVRTPLWRTPLALLAYLLGMAFVLTTAYRWRVRLIRDGNEQLLASERRARDSERRFRAIFEQALDGHLLLEDGRVQAANAVAARLFGADTPDALQQRRLSDLLAVDGDIPSSTTPREATIPRAGDAIPVQYTVTGVPSASRTLQHVVVRDLTEVRKAEAERAWFEAQVREAQKLESLGTLAGGVAHDFNNVLGVIRGNAELARTALRKGRSNDDNLSAILDASDRARDIVRQILTFSRRSTPTREYVNLSRLVLDLQPLLRRMVPRTVHLIVEGADRQHLVMGDPTQLQQLLLNLVSNAEYAMRSRTDGVLTIALSGRTVPSWQAAPTGDVVVLQVRDTGEGMSADVRARIFEPFFTTKPTGEGTGLGMAVVHGIVVSHQGRAEVMSEPGQGTTFELRFPRAVIEGLWDEDTDPTALLEPEDAAAEVVAARGARGSVAADDAATVARIDADEGARAGGLGDVLYDGAFAGTTIVVVDDEPAVAKVVERALQHYGHVVRVFLNPEPALAFIREQPSAVDLLITDQTMPGMTGDMLAEAAHALRGDLPVLILTGFSHRLTPERVAAARAHMVLLKPVELATLKQAVDQALASAERR